MLYPVVFARKSKQWQVFLALLGITDEGLTDLENAKEISSIRASRIPAERVRKRAEYEERAKEIILANISSLSWNSIELILSTIDSDFWNGEEIKGRFYPLLCKPNRNRIKENSIKQIEDFLLTILEKDDLASIDAKISNLSGVSYGAASLFFYIKDRNRYNVFLPATTKGIKVIYPEKARNLIYGQPFERNYALFNSLCNDLKKEFSVEPQELDILLTIIGKREQTEPAKKIRNPPVDKTGVFKIADHFEAEALLLEIGNLLGYETYTADPSKISKGEKLGEIASTAEVPEILSSIKNIERIDVIWYKEDSPPNYFFEVEDKGTMRDALHRLYQTRHLNARFFIVGPEDNRQKFEEWISTAPYNSSRKLYCFRTFEELSQLYSSIRNAENLKKSFGIT